MLATEAIPVTCDMTPSSRIRNAKTNSENAMKIRNLHQLADFFRPSRPHVGAFDLNGPLAGWNPRLVSYVRKYNVTVHTHIEDILSESLADATDALLNNYEVLNIGIINRIIYCRCMDYHNPKRNKSKMEEDFAGNIADTAYTREDYDEGLTFWQAFEELSEADKSVLLLSYFFNLSVQEIVDEINELEEITTHGLIQAALKPVVHKLRTIARKPAKNSSLEIDPQKLVKYKSVESRLSRAREHFWKLLVAYGIVQDSNKGTLQENSVEPDPDTDEGEIFSMNGSILGEMIEAGLLKISAASGNDQKPEVEHRRAKARKKKSPIETIYAHDTVDLRQYDLV